MTPARRPWIKHSDALITRGERGGPGCETILRIGGEWLLMVNAPPRSLFRGLFADPEAAMAAADKADPEASP